MDGLERTLKIKAGQTAGTAGDGSTTLDYVFCLDPLRISPVIPAARPKRLRVAQQVLDRTGGLHAGRDDIEGCPEFQAAFGRSRAWSMVRWCECLWCGMPFAKAVARAACRRQRTDAAAGRVAWCRRWRTAGRRR